MMFSKRDVYFVLFKRCIRLNETRNYTQIKKYHFNGDFRILCSTIMIDKKMGYQPLRQLSNNESVEETAFKNDYSDDLIIYNSIKNFTKSEIVDKRRKRNKNLINEKPLPVFLKYMFIEENQKETSEDGIRNNESLDLVNFPYSTTVKIKNIEDVNYVSTAEFPAKNQEETNQCFPEIHFLHHGKKWMNDYEKYTEENEEINDFNEWQLDYGTCSPSKPISKVPCGGCGALLHCQDPAIPGYLPSEIFSKCNNKDLLSITCQRCHFMKNYNTALAVNVDQQLYPKLLARIRDETALVMLMVDLTDFPCSIWPGILDIIGIKRPLFIVGNKVDLLWGDQKSWLVHVEKILRSSFPPEANIKSVNLISAKTGFGVEELINKLHNIWKYKGDVYLIGCTNVGKSTLFNALLQSDYCKVKAVDLLQRATTAPWPGTTLNLLKFPILRPEGWRLYLRTLRLINDRKKASFEKKLNNQLKMINKTKEYSPPQLIGHIGRTFTKTLSDEDIQSANHFTIPNRKQMDTAVVVGSGLDPNDPDFVNGRWFYDTPGVLHTDQVLDLLTTEELMLTIPKKVINPRTFLIKPNWTIFIAGLARLDYSEGNVSVRLTVFSSSSLPITICKEIDADQLYNDLLGTEYMVVPKNSNERLKQWPLLKNTEKISLIGINGSTSCADIILSSAGWVSVTADSKEICKFTPWTPLGRGVHVRVPSLLPYAVNLRGKLIRKTPAYGKTKPFA